MAFETSEAFYAGLSTFDTARLERAKNNQEEFNLLYEESINAFQSSALDGAGNATKQGMMSTIASKTRQGRGAKGLGSLYSDLASQISAVIGTRKSIGQDGPPSAVYLTGNKWHQSVQPFKIEAFGMKDYNSSDVILQYGNIYYGISLKKKPYESSASPPLINSSFATFLQPKEFSSMLQRVNAARYKFFAKILWDACQDNTPNSPFWVQELNEGKGGTILECRQMFDFKTGKGKNVQTGQFNIQGIRLQRDGTLSLEDAKRILDIRVNVYKPSGNSSPRAGEYGESDWKLERNVPLINIKDTEHMDSLGARFPTEFRTRFRSYVNSKLSARGGQISQLWTEFDKILMDERPGESVGGTPRSFARILADSILTRTLKLNLYSELEKFNAPEFEFLLVEGVGKAVDDKKTDDQFKATFGAPVVKPLRTIIGTIADLCPLQKCGIRLERIDASEAKAAVEYKLIISPPAKEAKKLGFSEIDVLHIDLRYGGSFKSMPRFHATMTSEFMQLAKGK